MRLPPVLPSQRTWASFHVPRMARQIHWLAGAAYRPHAQQSSPILALSSRTAALGSVPPPLKDKSHRGQVDPPGAGAFRQQAPKKPQARSRRQWSRRPSASLCDVSRYGESGCARRKGVAGHSPVKCTGGMPGGTTEPKGERHSHLRGAGTPSSLWALYSSAHRQDFL